MVDSGVRVAAAAQEEYKNLQLKKKYHYLILKIEGESVVVDKVTTSDQPYSYDKFIQDLKGIEDAKKNPEGHIEPRIGILDYHYQLPNNGGDRSKVVCVNWTNPKAKVALKMKYSSTINTVKNSLLGIHIHHQASDDSDLAESEILEKALKSA